MDMLLVMILLLLISSFLFTSYKLDKNNLSFYLVIIVLVGYILAFRNTKLLGLDFNVSCIVVSTVFPILSLYLEKFKLKETKELLGKINIVLLIFMIMLMLITGYVSSVTNDSAVYIHTIFGNNFRILVAYPLSIIISQYLYIYFYMESKEMYNNTVIILLIANSIIGILEIILFVGISYLFSVSILNLLYFLAINYVIRMLVVVIYAFLIYGIHLKKKVKK